MKKTISTLLLTVGLGCVGSEEETQTKQAGDNPSQTGASTPKIVTLSLRDNPDRICAYEARNTNREAFKDLDYTVGVTLNEYSYTPEQFKKSLPNLGDTVLGGLGAATLLGLGYVGCVMTVIPDPADTVGNFILTGSICAVGPVAAGYQADATTRTEKLRQELKDAKIDGDNFRLKVNSGTFLQEMIDVIQGIKVPNSEQTEENKCPQIVTAETGKDGLVSEEEYQNFLKSTGTFGNQLDCGDQKYITKVAVPYYSGNQTGSKIINAIPPNQEVFIASPFKKEDLQRTFISTFVKSDGSKENGWVRLSDLNFECR